MKLHDGGPAYPGTRRHAGHLPKGMSLRDWFAGMALQALISVDDQRGADESESMTELARLSYSAAKAMLEVRGDPDPNVDG